MESNGKVLIRQGDGWINALIWANLEPTDSTPSTNPFTRVQTDSPDFLAPTKPKPIGKLSQPVIFKFLLPNPKH
jgi:hypothetical protein